MPRISLQTLLASVLTVAVIFALFNNASQLPPHQDWKSITCSADGKWLFAVANENGYLIDLETNQVSSKFNIYGGMYSDIKTVAFIDNETIIAIDSQRRVAPRIVWISIPKNKITKEFSIPAHTQAAVSRKYFYSKPTIGGASFDIRDARTSKLVTSWTVPGNSSLAFSHDGNLLIRSNDFTTAARSRSPILVFDIQAGKQVASYGNSLQCLIRDDPTDPILINGLNSAHFRDKEYPGYYYRCARYSVDGTRLNTGAVIIDSETGDILVDFERFRGKFGSPNVLSADNQKLFLSNQNVDRGISVYDSSSLVHLYDIRVSRSRWQVAGFGFLMIMAVAAVWVLIVNRQRRRDAAHGLVQVPTPPASPAGLRIVWKLMVFGGLVHLAFNVFLIHNIPFASTWKRDSQFSMHAYASAMLVVGLLFAGLLIALVVFVKGATSSMSRLRLTAVVQMLIDPINTMFGIASLLILSKSKPNQVSLGDLDGNQ